MCRNDIMLTTPRNLAYEVDSEEANRILKQPSASQSFIYDCRTTAQKYQRKKIESRIEP